MLSNRGAHGGLRTARRLLTDRAVLLALVVVAALVGVTAVGTGLVLRDGEEASTRHLDATTELAAAYLDAEIQALADVVTTWTSRPATTQVLSSADDGRLPARTSELGFGLAESLRLARKGVQYAFLTDADGISIANSPRNPRALGAGFADRDWYRGAVRSGRTYVSEIYRARATSGQPWVFAVASPVYARAADGSRGALLGLVAATFPLDALQAFLDSTAHEQEVLRLVDHHGRLAGRTSVPIDIGRTVDEPEVQAALSGRWGVTRREVAGVDSFVAWRPLPSAGWALTSTQPVSRAMAVARQSALALAVLAGVLVVAVVAITVVYRIARARREANRAEVEAVRRAAADRFEALYRSSPVGIVEGSADGTIYSVNDAMAEMLGYRPEELVGRNASLLAFPDSAPHDLMTGQQPGSPVERLYRHRDGHAVPVVVSVSAVGPEDQPVRRLVASVTDITGLRESERALRTSEQRFRTAFQASLVGTLLLDEDGRVRQVNPAAEGFFGLTADQLVGEQLVELAPEQDRAHLAEALRAALAGERPHLEVPFAAPSGVRRYGYVGMTATPGADGAVLVQVEDVTERRAAEDLLSRQALHDPLTRLPNRRLLLDRIEHCLAARSRRAADAPPPGLLFIDLDGFKSINDRFGHETGDAVLCEVADRLRAATRPTDTVARLGGDEFVVLDEAVEDPKALQSLAHRLVEALAGPWPPGRELTASIGMALAQPAATAEGLLRDADEAMYRAKSLGRNRFEAYDERLRASAEQRVRVEHELREAVGAGNLVVEYQPVVDLATLNVIGLEALVRLPKQDGALAPPADFIAVAEDTGLVVPLGVWVLEHVCARVASWHRATGRWMPVAVNVSAQHAGRPDLAQTILTALAAHRVPGHALSLELTETVLLSATRSTLRQLDQLREHGVQVGLDDFGTGFSSLTYLVQLPMDFLKVDRSFVAGLPGDRRSRAIVESTVALALRLGLTCIVEGIETEAQLAFVRGLGPVAGQGYLLGTPFEEQAVGRLVVGLPSPRRAGDRSLVW